MPRRKRTASPIAGALAVAIAALALAGCDGVIRVRGAVHELVLAPAGAESRAFIDEPPPMTDPVRPVEGARVVLYHGGDDPEDPIDETTPWQWETTTDAEGRFELGGPCNWRRFFALLRVEKPGFRPVRAVFERGQPGNTAVILLVREPGE